MHGSGADGRFQNTLVKTNIIVEKDNVIVFLIIVLIFFFLVGTLQESLSLFAKQF